MQEIVETRKKLGALVQWVKVIYSAEMGQASHSSSLVPQSNEVFGGEQIRGIINKSLSSGFNPV